MKWAPWLPWWYLAISAGFALLALSHIISDDKPLPIVIRLIISAGFGFLAYMEFKAQNDKGIRK